jgi:two-component system response regulator HydG
MNLPPLRERKSDIPVLVQLFLEKFADAGRPLPTLAEDALTRLTAYDWPGNVRELENAIERAVALGSGPILHSGDLPPNLRCGVPGPIEPTPSDGNLVPLEELERRSILRAVRESNGDKLVAARLLGIGKTTLYRKLKLYESYSAAG